MSRKRRVFSSEFKQKVVQEVLSGSSQVQVAARHSLSANTVNLWMHHYRNGRLGGEATGDAKLAQLLSENRELKQLVGQKELEIEFLKRATALLHERSNDPSLIASGGPVLRRKRNARS